MSYSLLANISCLLARWKPEYGTCRSSHLFWSYMAEVVSTVAAVPNCWNGVHACICSSNDIDCICQMPLLGNAIGRLLMLMVLWWPSSQSTFYWCKYLSAPVPELHVSPSASSHGVQGDTGWVCRHWLLTSWIGSRICICSAFCSWGEHGNMNAADCFCPRHPCTSCTWRLSGDKNMNMKCWCHHVHFTVNEVSSHA